MGQLGRAGSPVRMAVLLHLAQHPGGVWQGALLQVVARAAARPVTEPQALQVLIGMRGDKLLARERRAAVPGQPEQWLWFSPGARQAAAVRGHWRPQASPGSPDARAGAQAALAIARARGLAADPYAD